MTFQHKFNSVTKAFNIGILDLQEVKDYFIVTALLQLGYGVDKELVNIITNIYNHYYVYESIDKLLKDYEIIRVLEKENSDFIDLEDLE